MAEAKQERAVRTRQTILRAAAVVFDRSGYEVASIADILKEAEITKGALYFHFSSKEALAQAVMAEQVNLVQAPQHEVHLQSAIDLTLMVAARLRADPVMRAGIRLTVEQGTWKNKSVEPYLDWIDLLHGLFQESRAELLPGTDPRQAAELVVAAFTGVQLLSEVLTGRQDVVARITSFWNFALPGLVVPGMLTRLRTVPPDSN